MAIDINGTPMREAAQSPKSPVQSFNLDSSRTTRTFRYQGNMEVDRFRAAGSLLGFAFVESRLIPGGGPGGMDLTRRCLRRFPPDAYPAVPHPFVNPQGIPYQFCTDISKIEPYGKPLGIDNVDRAVYDWMVIEAQYNTVPYFVKYDWMVTETPAGGGGGGDWGLEGGDGEWWLDGAGGGGDYGLSTGGGGVDVGPGSDQGAQTGTLLVSGRAAPPVASVRAAPPPVLIPSSPLVGLPDDGWALSRGWIYSRFISRVRDYAPKTITIRNGLPKIVSDDANKRQAIPEGLPFSQYRVRVSYTWHAIPTAAIPDKAMYLLANHVNQAYFDFAPPGTLVYCSSKEKPTQGPLGDVGKLVDLEHNFLFCPNVNYNGVDPNGRPKYQVMGHNAVPRAVKGTDEKVRIQWTAISSDGLHDSTPSAINDANRVVNNDFIIFKYGDLGRLFRPPQGDD